MTTNYQHEKQEEESLLKGHTTTETETQANKTDANVSVPYLVTLHRIYKLKTFPNLPPVVVSHRKSAKGPQLSRDALTVGKLD